MVDNTLQNLISEVWRLKLEKETIDTNINQLTSESKNLEKEINSIESKILETLNTNNILEFVADNDLIATKFSKSNVGYTNEEEVIIFLKNYYNGLGTKEKSTVSLDKNALKKELKVNEQLKADLQPYLINSLTEYVVVTTKENHERMLEHIKK